MKRIFLTLFVLLILALPANAALFLQVESDGNPKTTDLAWDANSEPDLAGYKVYRGTIPGTYQLLDTLDLGELVDPISPSYVTDEQFNGTYYFVVTAFNTAGLESGYSNEVSDSILTAPAAPTGLQRIAETVAWLLHGMAEGVEARLAELNQE